MVRMFRSKRSNAAFAFATALLGSPVAALAQANGDPGAAMGGQAAAQHAKSSRQASGDQKSGANAMSKGASGGKGGSTETGGSNATSGSGDVAPKH